jgi:hypothetical protein
MPSIAEPVRPRQRCLADEGLGGVWRREAAMKIFLLIMLLGAIGMLAAVCGASRTVTRDNHSRLPRPLGA